MFSLEMSRGRCSYACCAKARVDSHKMRTVSLWRDDMDKVVRAMDQRRRRQFSSTIPRHFSQRDASQKARRLQQSQGALDLVIVDYFQLMSGGSRRYENRTQEVLAISWPESPGQRVEGASSCSLAVELRSGAVAADHRPQLADLRNRDRSSKMPMS
jgi:replicative DNA helicase